MNFAIEFVARSGMMASGCSRKIANDICHGCFPPAFVNFRVAILAGLASPRSVPKLPSRLLRLLLICELTQAPEEENQLPSAHHPGMSGSPGGCHGHSAIQKTLWASFKTSGVTFHGFASRLLGIASSGAARATVCSVRDGWSAVLKPRQIIRAPARPGPRAAEKYKSRCGGSREGVDCHDHERDR